MDKIQEWKDSNGEGPTMPAGTRITWGPDRDPTKQGTVIVQKLQWDGDESFFGNLIVRMDDGREGEVHVWQCRKVEE